MSTDAPAAPRHVAVLLSDRAHMSSVGVIVDAVSMVAAQVQRQHRQPMQTRARLLGYRTDTVKMTGGVPLATDGRIDRRESFRLVYLPAFEVVDDAEVTDRLLSAAGIFPWLQRQRKEGAVLAAAGNAVLLLAEAGLLDGARASVPRALVPAFRRRYSRRVQVETRSAVVDRDGVVFTAATPAAEWSLAVHAIESAISPQMSTWLAVRSGLRRTGGDDRLAEDPLVASAQFWLGERYGEPELSIATLARHLAVSHATLLRRFARSIGMTPRSYLRRLRVDAAKRMLQTTSRSVQQVALMVGYADARAFRSVFVEMTGTNPTAWRRARQ